MDTTQQRHATGHNGLPWYSQAPFLLTSGLIFAALIWYLINFFGFLIQPHLEDMPPTNTSQKNYSSFDISFPYRQNNQES